MVRRRWFLGLPLAGIAFTLLGLLSPAAGCVTGNGNDPVDAGSYVAEVTVVLDGGGPVPSPPDGVAACPLGACNYQSGSGCEDAGSCVPLPGLNGIAPSCFASGTGPTGSACSQWSDCAPGHLCDSTGHCRRLCCGGDWTACTGGEHCLRQLELAVDGGPVATGAMLCYPANACNPLTPESCSEPGTTCQIADPTGASACLPQGTGGVGEACPCRGGFLCVVEGSKQVCHRLCKAVEGGGAPYCPVAEGVCTHFNRDPLGVGECTH